MFFSLFQNNLPVELLDVDVFEGEHKQPSFTALNPHQEVPVLVDGKTNVFEGYVLIISYKASRQLCARMRLDPKRITK